MMNNFTYASKLGKITIHASNEAITHIIVNEENPKNTKETPLIKQAIHEINEYLENKRKTFTIKLDPQGTEYQKKAWQALIDIPYGTTNTYKQVATTLGNDKASRAIGMACNKNPIMIMIPCHRVLGSNGALTGYSGGLDVKEQLLHIERNQ